MLAAVDFKPVSDLMRSEDIEPFWRLEQAVHEIAHVQICQGHLDTFTADSILIDELVQARYRTPRSQDLHELRTSVVTAFALRLLVEDCPEDIEDYCLEATDGNLNDLSVRMNRDLLYRNMVGHKVNLSRAQVVADYVHYLNEMQA